MKMKMKIKTKHVKQIFVVICEFFETVNIRHKIKMNQKICYIDESNKNVT